MNESTKDFMQSFLEGTNLKNLYLEESEFNCKIESKTSSCIIADVPFLRLKLKNTKLFNSSIKVLNIGSIIIRLNDRPLAARDIVHIIDLKTLVELDVSEAPIITSPNSESLQPVADDALSNFFDGLRQTIGSSIKILKMVNWKFKLTNMD